MCILYLYFKCSLAPYKNLIKSTVFEKASRFKAPRKVWTKVILFVFSSEKIQEICGKWSLSLHFKTTRLSYIHGYRFYKF